MATQPVKEIRYVCIARRTDNVIVAQHLHTPSNVNFVQSVKGVLGSPGWARLTSDRLTLDDGDNTFYVLIDDAQRVYIVVVSKSYPARLIYDSADGRTEGFLSALQKAFVARFGEGSLTCGPDEYTSRCRTMLKELCTKFNDLKGVDKTAMVQAQVNEVAATMSKAVTAAVERGEKATDLQDRTHQLAQTADKFEHGSKTLKNQMMWRNAKVMILIAVVIIIVLIIIIATAAS